MNCDLAEKLAKQKMDEHGLAKAGWSFKWDNAVRRSGQCRPLGKVVSLSRPITELREEGEVLDTILHEIAHALVGRDVRSHGPEWKARGIEIGCNGARCCIADRLPPLPRKKVRRALCLVRRDDRKRPIYEIRLYTRIPSDYTSNIGAKGCQVDEYGRVTSTSQAKYLR